MSDQSLARESLSELVARCDDAFLVTLVDGLLDSAVISAPKPLRSPQIGTVQIQVREPICRERFILSDALVTIAEVMVDESLGWAMRLGANPAAAMAAAVLDGWLSGPDFNQPTKVDVIGRLQTADRAAQFTNQLRRREILGTAIEFEELD